MNRGEWALITGASSGIGKDFARIHAEHGGNLILVARRKNKLVEIQDELQNTYSVRVLVIPKDLSLPNSSQEIVEEITGEGLPIHYLINNAGFGRLGSFSEAPLEYTRNMIQLNITALTELCRFVLPEFTKNGYGKILNVSSVASLIPGGPYMAVYYATKAYVTSFSLALSEELKNRDISITTLLPGATDTEFGDVAGIKETHLFKKRADVLAVARKGYRSMLAGKRFVITGLPFSQRIQIKLMPLIPHKIILKIVGGLHGYK